MKCPICKKEFADEKYKPFCCKRCADIDLGNWFNGAYAIPVQEMNEDDAKELVEALENQIYEEEQ